jgi:hypothetical protein
MTIFKTLQNKRIQKYIATNMKELGLGCLVIPIIYGYSIGESLIMLGGVILYMLMGGYWIMKLSSDDDNSSDNLSLICEDNHQKWMVGKYFLQFVRNLNVVFLFLSIHS